LAGEGALGTFALAHVVAGAGDAFVAVSLAGSLFFNVSPDASRNQVLLYLAITMVPFAVLAPLVGPAVDRYRGGYRGLASLTYGLRALAAIGLAFTLYDLSFYVLALALLVASKTSGVVRQALVPRLVDDLGRLVEVNSRLALLGTVVGSIAGLLAAVALSVVGGPGLLAIACVLFLVAATVVWWLPATLPASPTIASVEYAELHTPSVVIASAGLMALRAGVGYFVFMLAFALRRESEPAWVYGLVVAGYGVGAFVGNLVAPIVRRRVNEEMLMAAALIAAASMCTLGLLGVNRASLTALAAVLGLAASAGRQAFDSLLQRSAPDALRGQAFARYETRFQLTWVLGALLATAVSLPVPLAMAVLTALFVPAVVLYVRGARQALRFEPPPGEGPFAPATSHLAAAVAWRSAGHLRHAVIEASAAVDLARAAGATAPPSEDNARIEALRRCAVEGRGSVSDGDVDDAVRIARAVLDVRPQEPPS
jgi:MFS family permease